MYAVVLLLAVIGAFYFYGTRTYGYWKKRGVKHDRPIPFLGNSAKNFLMLKNFCDTSSELYRKYPRERVVGFYRGTDPELIIRDPELAKRILIMDFSRFYPRGLLPQREVVEPLLRNLFFADGDVWRLLRQRMTPAFSGGKVRAMFPLITERAECMQARALRLAAADDRGRVDVKDLLTRYSTDFIGACGFGLDVGSLRDEDSIVAKMSSKIFQHGVKECIVNLLKSSFPWAFSRVNSMARVEGDIKYIVNEVQKQRNYRPSGRNDFIDLMLECKAEGTIVGKSMEWTTPSGEPEVATLEMDDELMAAQVFVFFAAGFETSSSATSTTLNELAHNPAVQARAQAEIDRVLAKHGGKLSYDAVKEMTYLEWTLKESMRVFPSPGFLVRRCARPFTVDGLTIDEGIKVFIPLAALHNDPQYFDNPNEFRPERFDPAHFDPRNKYVYMPFGIGPRACIGERLGLMQSLAGLAAVLARFTVRPAPGAPRRPVVSPAADLVQTICGGMPLTLIPRKTI
ncbi:cytochrome P450 6B6-like [Aricia agestis]|uniref:cytochrome P450 6B6-like n=1 Tax=Aricia agestis TaxID=91739 RepID=UPI001C208AB8|nr:cytochrome P450 6B6-like [Aricia agestis]